MIKINRMPNLLKIILRRSAPKSIMSSSILFPGGHLEEEDECLEEGFEVVDIVEAAADLRKGYYRYRFF